MDDSSNGLDAHTTDIGSHSEGGDFSSDSVIYAETIWPQNKAGGVESAQTALARPRLRRKPVAHRISEINNIIIGSSPQAVALRNNIRLYAEDDSPVLISGETGVGKELVARQLHLLGPRSKSPFVPLNIGAIPEMLSASELFGHKKGAFTGALADHDGAFLAAQSGTLFLDEIGDTPLTIQAQLLRVLDDGMVTRVGGRTLRKVDFRLVAATNVDLRESMSAGKFRRDLFYRVNVLVIDVPPLRERGDDVIEIAESIIAANPAARRQTMRLTPSAAERLKAHQFPGNVRELRNVLMRAIVHARGPKILDEHITFDHANCSDSGSEGFPDATQAKELISRFLMIKALKLADGNVSKAAKLAGRSRGTVHALKKQLSGEDFASVYKSACTELKALIGDC
ncbi:MAG: sigma-54-dependent Fis family transcriptional regulator [Marinicaulis sp.]|nr:sigma-54-dependent Fis family transcriptional regulator [Marinicaulis sp.]